MNRYLKVLLSVFILVFIISTPEVMAQLAPATEPLSAASSADTAALQPSLGTVHVPAIVVYTRPTEREKVRLFVFDAFGPIQIAKAALGAGVGEESNSPPEWGKVEWLWETGGKQLWHPGSDDDNTLRNGRDFSRRHCVLSLRVHRVFSPCRPCAAFYLYGTPRRRRAYRVFVFQSGFTVCRHDDGARMVSGPLWCAGRISNGQLQPSGPRGRKSASGVYLWRAAHPAGAPS